MFVVYGKPNCIWCDRAKEFLFKREEQVLFYDITNSSLVYEAFRRYFPNAQTVPQILLAWGDDYEIIGGHDDLVKYFK